MTMPELTARGALKPGSTLNGTYEIVRRISEGGMGEIYEARHVRLTGGYAVKVLRPEIRSRDESAFARFRREAEVTSSLRHPHIVQVIDFNETPDGAPYFVMELLAGQNLADHLAAHGPLPFAHVAVIVEQVASALQAAHERGIVHRDLKPENLHLEPVAGRREPYVKVLDFGISKVLAASSLTQESVLVGTPFYMSPEQARGHSDDIDGRTDQFALATIAHELLTGRRAFDAPEVYAVLYRVLHEEPPALTPVAGEAVQRVVARAMHKNRDERFATVMAFAEAFRAAVPAPRPSGAFAATALSPAPFAAPSSSVLAPRAATAEPPAPVAGATASLPGPTASVGRPATGRRTWLFVAAALLAVAGGGAYWFTRPAPGWAVAGSRAQAPAQALADELGKVVAGQQAKLAETALRGAAVPELGNAVAGRVDETTFQDLLATEIWWSELRPYGAAVVGPAGVAVSWHLPAGLTAKTLLAALPETPNAGRARVGVIASAGVVWAAAAPIAGQAGSWLLLTQAVDRALVTELASRSNLILLLSDGHQVLALSVPEATSPEIATLVGREGARSLVDEHRQRLAAAWPWHVAAGGPLWLWGVTAWRP
jgi:tRNA A-37 threonylcarbamoyl transferase component Bud32